jgi:hypothetical protein
MKIIAIKTSHFRNNEHFQFHTEVKDIITKHGAAALKIQAQFDAYLPLYEKLDEGIKKINKSAFTADIQDADRARDEIWSAMKHMNAAALRNPAQEVRESAKRLKIIFDTYGNVAKMPLNEQTAAIYNLLQDLQGKYAADVTAARLKTCVDELQASNAIFENLMKDRFDEAAAKTDVVVKEARAALDEAYRDIAVCINALTLMEGAAVYEQFVRALNVVVEKYAAALARRR